MRLTIDRAHTLAAQALLEADAEDIYADETENRLLLLDGQAFDVDDLEKRQPLSARALATRFRERGTALSATLSGLYTIVAYDPARQRALCFQDAFGGRETLYFCRAGGRFHLDTSLKPLLKHLPAPRALRTEAVEQFFRLGVVPGGATLVRGIDKLPQGRIAALNAASGRVEYFRNRYAEKRAPKPASYRAYAENFVRAFSACLRGVERPALALSGGYDTNLILHAMQRRAPAALAAFCVGGSEGVDETAVAEKIARAYGNVSLRKATVDGRTLNRLPDIVFRLEGAVYESGIFLQYLLAREARQANVRDLALGEGADQVMDIANCRGLCCLLSRFWPAPRDLLGGVILKKSARMLASFGVRGHYPFLEEGYLRAARALYGRNGAHKHFHRQAVSACIKPEAAALLDKVGGSTSVRALFDGGLSFADFRDLVTALPAHDPTRPIRHRKTNLESQMEYCLQLAYLYVFERVFLSGDFDEQLGEASLDTPLRYFLAEIAAHAPLPRREIHPPLPNRLRRAYNRGMWLCFRAQALLRGGAEGWKPLFGLLSFPALSRLREF